MCADSVQTYRHWRVERDAGNIVWLCIDKADGSANVLSGPVLRELSEIIGPFRVTPPAGIVIHSGKQNGFVMGADINEFTTIRTADEAYALIRLGQQVMDAVEELPCPSVAAINGFALGGGLELALACSYRIAFENDKPILGLPEVQLGIHPGFGGTVRAVRISGVRPAMKLMLTGQPITVATALRQRLVDGVTTESAWRQAATDLIHKQPARATAPILEKILNLPALRPFIVKALRKQVRAKARPDHYPAPYAIIELWSRYGAVGKAAFEAEARSIASLMCGSTSRNLVRVFFLQNRLKGQGQKPSTRIRRVHVVGAGVMGGDIAAWCAFRGLDVTLQDRAGEYIQPALQRAQKLFDKKVRDAGERKATASRLRADVAGDCVADADLVIEAIFENVEAKQDLYRKLQDKMKDSAVLATNTSSIRLETLRSVLHQPQRFIGLHFFNPVAMLPLVEVIRCKDTESGILDIGFAFVKAIGKFPLECASSPGFVVNRVLAPYMAEAMHLAESGVALSDIDRIAEDFGMPMGPVELVDSVGLDVALHVSRVLGAEYGRPVPSHLTQMVANGRLGRKSGQGFYKWVDGKAIKPVTHGRIPDDATDRLMLPMVNEAVACLHERIVGDADLLDAGVIFGTGFAPFRGGPLQYARDRGPAEIEQTLLALSDKYGDRFRPHAGWAQLR
jgi:3-hydroxyacyl-CoA dehydrogenase/enoyl-CoA hydratase/3-hydroxybutyryl-CoA epimerase